MKKYYFKKTHYSNENFYSQSNSNYLYHNNNELMYLTFESDLDIVFILVENTTSSDNEYDMMYCYYNNGVITPIKNSNNKPTAYYRYYSNTVDDVYTYKDVELNTEYYNTPESNLYIYRTNNKWARPTSPYFNVDTNILCFDNEDAVINYYQNGDMSGIVNINMDSRLADIDTDTNGFNYDEAYYNFYHMSPFSDTSIDNIDTYNKHTNAIKQSRYSDAAKELSLAYPEVKGGTAHVLNDFEKSIVELENKVDDYLLRSNLIQPYIYSDTEPTDFNYPYQFLWQRIVE